MISMSTPTLGSPSMDPLPLPPPSTMDQMLMENRSLRESLEVCIEFKRILEHMFQNSRLLRTGALTEYKGHYFEFYRKYRSYRKAFSDHLARSIERLDDVHFSKCFNPNCTIVGCNEFGNDFIDLSETDHPPRQKQSIDNSSGNHHQHQNRQNLKQQQSQQPTNGFQNGTILMDGGSSMLENIDTTNNTNPEFVYHLHNPHTMINNNNSISTGGAVPQKKYSKTYSNASKRSLDQEDDSNRSLLSTSHLHHRQAPVVVPEVTIDDDLEELEPQQQQSEILHHEQHQSADILLAPSAITDQFMDDQPLQNDDQQPQQPIQDVELNARAEVNLDAVSSVIDQMPAAVSDQIAIGNVVHHQLQLSPLEISTSLLASPTASISSISPTTIKRQCIESGANTFTTASINEPITSVSSQPPQPSPALQTQQQPPEIPLPSSSPPPPLVPPQLAPIHQPSLVGNQEAFLLNGIKIKSEIIENEMQPISSPGSAETESTSSSSDGSSPGDPNEPKQVVMGNTKVRISVRDGHTVIHCKVNDCNRTFLHPSEANEHYKSHSKLFKCSVCHLLFSSKHFVFKHFHTHNPPSK